MIDAMIMKTDLMKDIEDYDLLCDIEEAFGIVSKYVGHHCNSNQFQINWKMYSYPGIPSFVEEQLSMEDINNIIHKEYAEQGNEYIYEIIDRYDWIKDAGATGRSMGWLIITTHNDHLTYCEEVIDELKYTIIRIEDNPANNRKEMEKLKEDYEIAKDDLNEFKILIDIAKDLQFIEKEIKERQKLMFADIELDEFWDIA